MKPKVAPKFSSEDQAKMRSSARVKEDPIDFSKPYFVMAIIEDNKEVFTSPKGKPMVDLNQRKKTNSHLITLRVPGLSADNKMIMNEVVVEFNFPGRTDDFANDNNYAIEDVNRALYMSKCCYPHREAMFRMFDIDDLEPIESSDEAEEIMAGRVADREAIHRSETTMSKNSGRFDGAPGRERPIPQSGKAKAANVEGDDLVNQMLASGEIENAAW